MRPPKPVNKPIFLPRPAFLRPKFVPAKSKSVNKKFTLFKIFKQAVHIEAAEAVQSRPLLYFFFRIKVIKSQSRQENFTLKNNEDNFFAPNFEMSPSCLKLSLFYARGKPLGQKSENFNHSGNISKVREKKSSFFQELVFIVLLQAKNFFFSIQILV